MLQTIMTMKNPSVNNKEQSKEIIDEDDHYVKLLDICRNEHYGDIMMFLNQRSPLSVRVSSRIVELFSLKKTDVIEISMLFPNIWKEIITNSIYNMHQINILIKKTLTFFYYNNEYALEKMKKRFEPEYLIGACQLIRRDAYEAAGPLDEKIFYGPEDADFCLRVKKAGFSLAYVPEFTVLHHCQRMSRSRILSPIGLKHIEGLVHLYFKYKRLF